jgi:predicted Zn-dependent peptidase
MINVPGSQVIDLEVRFNSGYVFGSRSRYETPHVLEHLLATTSAKYPKANQFMIEASKNGAYVNAYTTARANGYTYEMADFELERMLDLIEEQLARPLFTREHLTAELGNVREELSRNTTQPAAVCALTLAAATQPDQYLYYDQRLDQLADISLVDIQKHFSTTHAAANARFFVAGALSGRTTSILGRLEAMFQQISEGERLEYQAHPVDQGLAAVVTARDINQIYYRLERQVPEQSWDSRRALAVLRTILVGTMGSRILGAARTRGLAYTVGAASQTEPGLSVLGFQGFVTMDNSVALFQLIADRMQKVARIGVTAEEVTTAVQYMIGNILRSTQTAADVMNWYVDNYDGWESIRDMESEIAAFRAVTPEAVQAAAVMIDQEGHFAWSLVGPVGSGHVQALQQALGHWAM